MVGPVDRQPAEQVGERLTSFRKLARVRPPIALAVAESINDSCADTLSLNANQDAGTIGQWTVLDGNATFENANNALTNAILQAGSTATVAWSLTVDGCPEPYSQSVLELQLEKAPVATKDLLEVPHNEVGAIDLTNNDGLLNVSDWFVEIPQPQFGTLSQNAGEVEYEAPADYEGTQVLTYTLCNAICPDLCDAAELTIVALPIPSFVDESVVVPSGITPNGDGVNDELIISTLHDRPQDF
ncbi:MAG: Ig-like domain-containing protein, partial [Shimia sp.]